MRKALRNRVLRALRGGSFDFDSRDLRTSSRDGSEPEFRYWCNGFRLIARKVR
jgi:formylglycine-generating enzyme required for sulfatase activity